jgi:hypothetical protein
MNTVIHISDTSDLFESVPQCSDVHLPHHRILIWKSDINVLLTM